MYSAAPVHLLASCEEQIVPLEITDGLLWSEIQELMQQTFDSPLSRLEGRPQPREEWEDINDNDAWYQFRGIWRRLGSAETARPTMLIRVTKLVAEPAVIPQAPTQSAGIHTRVFDGAVGHHHQGGPFAWTQHELLGRGARGIVHKGLRADGVFIAVKEMDYTTAQQGMALANEVSLLARTNHPHIVKLLAHYPNPVTPREYFIVLEYFSHGSLRDLLATLTVLPTTIVISYLRQIAEGLAYLHSLHIVHRDIKSGNILIGDQDRVAIADFDVACQLTAADQDTGCTTRAGSCYWFSPELCRGEPYGVKTDVWALGCVMIELLTGDLPWPTFERAEAGMHMIAEATGPPPRLPQHLSPNQRSFAARCLERDPRQRASAGELLQHPYLA